ADLGLPLFARPGSTPAGSSLFQCQEPVGQHHQAGMVVEPPPGPALMVVQPELLLHLLVAEFHRPAAPPEADGSDPAGVRRQVAEGVLQLAVCLLLDQEPDRPPAGALPGRPALARPDTQPGEPAPHRPL